VGGSRFLLDTNAVIALQRDNADLKAVLQDASEVFIPIIVVGELYFGAYKSQLVENNRRAVADFVADRVVLRIDIDTAAAYGQVKQALRAKGRPIPENDIWIAALARQHELTLITDDGHFAEVEGLVTKNW
jgi:tRNA(fMet)-specific endonuclease VapC